MNTINLLALLLATSLAINLGFIGGCVAKASGQSTAASILVAIGIVVPTLALYFSAVSAYH